MSSENNLGAIWQNHKIKLKLVIGFLKGTHPLSFVSLSIHMSFPIGTNVASCGIVIQVEFWGRLIKLIRWSSVVQQQQQNFLLALSSKLKLPDFVKYKSV